MVDDFGPDFDKEGNPLEEGESDRISDEEERSRPGRTESEDEQEDEAEAEGEKAEDAVEETEKVGA